MYEVVGHAGAVVDASGTAYLIGGNNLYDGPWGGMALLEPIPEPCSMLLMGTGALGMFGVIRRRRRA